MVRMATRERSLRTPGVPPPMGEVSVSGDPRIGAMLKEGLLLGTRAPDTSADSPDRPDESPTPSDHSSGTDRWTHRFHTWPAGFHPDTAALILSGIEPGPVADPFCGGGTLLVEGLASGRGMIGRDLSPIAVQVARLRTTLRTHDVLTRFRSAARAAAARASQAKEPPSIDRRRVLQTWYEPHVMVELESLRRSCVEAEEAIADLMWGTFSAILIKTSLRASDTRKQVIARTRPPGTTAILFHKKARELARRLEALARVVPPLTPAPDIAIGDARTFTLPHPITAIVTSPPYPGVYDYLPMQHLREIWLGIRTDELREREIGARRAFSADRQRARKLWRRDLHTCMVRFSQALKEEGTLVLFIGDGRAGHEVVGVRQPVEEAAGDAGFRLLARAAMHRVDPWGAHRDEYAFWFVRDTGRRAAGLERNHRSRATGKER